MIYCLYIIYDEKVSLLLAGTAVVSLAAAKSPSAGFAAASWRRGLAV